MLEGAGDKRQEEQDGLIFCSPSHHPSFHHYGGIYEETEENQSFEGRLKEEKC